MDSDLMHFKFEFSSLEHTFPFIQFDFYIVCGGSLTFGQLIRA